MSDRSRLSASGKDENPPVASHQPVLLAEVLERLRVRPAGRYIDCTLGGGGHAAAVLERLDPAGRLLVLDRDPSAIGAWRRRCHEDPRCVAVQACFSDLAETVAAHGLADGVDGILADLGLSSLQLDDAQRGFSFLRAGELDMRMNQEQGESAVAWLQRSNVESIEKVLAREGDERYARCIARALAQACGVDQVTRADDLARVIESAVPRRERQRHPATRAFLALRRHVNDEAQELRALLRAAPGLLAVGGRLLLISFHALEDRVVKTQLRALALGGPSSEALEPPLPATTRFQVLGRPLRPGSAERTANRRSRSALLRVLERCQ